jgi:hypothetical protein
MYRNNTELDMSLFATYKEKYEYVSYQTEI